MKRIISCFLASICLCMILSGCSNKHGSEMISEARDLTTSQISVNPSKNDYGAPAYELLKQIQSDYPGRIAGAEKEKEMALFILSVLLNGGYSENDISVQSFTISDTAPAMAESINIFDGGEKSNLSQNIEVLKTGESEKTIIVGLPCGQ